MKRSAPFLIWLALATSAMATGLLQPSVYGDARLGYLSLITNQPGTGLRYAVTLPSGRHEGFTVCGWFRLKETGGSGKMTTFAFWCPEKIQYSNPDLLAGVGGFGSANGTNLTALGGSITIASFPFTPYTGAEVAPISNTWPRGVYTIAGWASNAVTVTLGGTDVVLGPGEFTKNAIPGPAASVVITGSGLASVGISKTPCYRFFDELDGVSEEASFSDASTISNQISFCVWRFKVDGTNQIYRSDLGRQAAFNEISQAQTNVMSSNGAFDSGGHYTVGFMGSQAPAYDLDCFDYRVFPWYLTDKELERIHLNGVEEITRRGIPDRR